MNVDTDTQYAFTRPIVDHMMKNYDGVLKIEGEVGNKKVYDPRTYLKLVKRHGGPGERSRRAKSCARSASQSAGNGSAPLDPADQSL